MTLTESVLEDEGMHVFEWWGGEYRPLAELIAEMDDVKRKSKSTNSNLVWQQYLPLSAAGSPYSRLFPRSPLRNVSTWRGSFEPSTATFLFERERGSLGIACCTGVTRCKPKYNLSQNSTYNTLSQKRGYAKATCFAYPLFFRPLNHCLL